MADGAARDGDETRPGGTPLDGGEARPGGAARPGGERRVLAVDGGQSAIRLRHSAGGSEVAVGGVSRQEGDVVGAVVAAVVDGWRAAGAPATDRVVLGLTTAPSEAASQERLCREVADAVGAAETWLADDAVTTHAGALAQGWGVSVTAGTGVACLAMPAGTGAPRIIGGHGFLLGDEGGAFWIGREGLRAVLRAADGRGPATALSAVAARRFDGLAELSARIHAMARPVNAIAHFAPDVLAVAADGDPVATHVVLQAVEELVTLVRAGVDASPPAPDDPDRTVPVALGGRLLARGSMLRTWLDRALDAQVPVAAHGDANGSPVDGAVVLGMAPDPGRYASLVVTWRRGT